MKRPAIFKNGLFVAVFFLSAACSTPGSSEEGLKDALEGKFSRSACWASTGWTPMTPRRPTSCECSRGGLLGVQLICIMMRRLQEDRAGDGYRGGSGRGVGDGGGVAANVEDPKGCRATRWGESGIWWCLFGCKSGPIVFQGNPVHVLCGRALLQI